MSSTFDLFGGGGGLSVHVVRACLIRLSFLLKFFPHFVHVYVVGGSLLMPVHVVRACLVRLSILLKFFPHFVHVYEVVFFFF